MEKKPKITRNPIHKKAEIEEVFEDYTIDYNDQAAGQKYFPIAGYVGVILAILVGAMIIGFSIIFSSDKAPALFGKESKIATNTNTTGAIEEDIEPAFVDIQISDEYPLLGSKDAPVTLVLFADFQCPFCKEFHDEVFQQIKAKYIDTGIAKFSFLHFPFLGPESEASAIASECARQQDKFWEFYDLLYKAQAAENSNAFSDTALKKMAKQLGLNAAKFAACQIDENTGQVVKEQFDLGKSYGVGATPTVFINGKKSEGSNPFASYQSAIEKAVNGK